MACETRLGVLGQSFTIAATTTQTVNVAYERSYLAPDGPVTYINGLVLVFSSTGCFSKTESATAFLAASYQ
jgi:hypothetical protein